jgi:hypothetical protein
VIVTDDGARHRDYRISIDRAGLALATGGATCGAIAAVLLALGGRHDLGTLASGLILGTIFSSLALAAVGGPVWLLLHAGGYRGPVTAALSGALIGFLLFLFGQIDLLGRGAAPPDAWLREIGSSLILAALAAAIALGMWRIAYRRVG